MTLFAMGGVNTFAVCLIPYCGLILAFAIESIKITSMENVSTEVLEKIKNNI